MNVPLQEWRDLYTKKGCAFDRSAVETASLVPALLCLFETRAIHDLLPCYQAYIELLLFKMRHQSNKSWDLPVDQLALWFIILLLAQRNKISSGVLPVLFSRLEPIVSLEMEFSPRYTLALTGLSWLALRDRKLSELGADLHYLSTNHKPSLVTNSVANASRQLGFQKTVEPTTNKLLVKSHQNRVMTPTVTSRTRLGIGSKMFCKMFLGLCLVAVADAGRAADCKIQAIETRYAKADDQYYQERSQYYKIRDSNTKNMAGIVQKYVIACYQTEKFLTELEDPKFVDERLLQNCADKFGGEVPISEDMDFTVLYMTREYTDCLINTDPPSAKPTPKTTPSANPTPTTTPSANPTPTTTPSANPTTSNLTNDSGFGFFTWTSIFQWIVIMLLVVQRIYPCASIQQQIPTAFRQPESTDTASRERTPSRQKESEQSTKTMITRMYTNLVKLLTPAVNAIHIPPHTASSSSWISTLNTPPQASDGSFIPTSNTQQQKSSGPPIPPSNAQSQPSSGPSIHTTNSNKIDHDQKRRESANKSAQNLERKYKSRGFM